MWLAGTVAAQQRSVVGIKTLPPADDSLVFALTYEPRGIALDSVMPVFAAVYAYEGYVWKVGRFRMTGDGSRPYEGKVSMASKAAVGYVLFYQGDFTYPDVKDDGGSGGYILPLTKKEKGYYVGLASVRRDSAMILLSKEWQLKGADTLKVAADYFRFLKESDPAHAQEKINQFINRWMVSPSASDDELMQLYYYAKTVMNSPALAARLREVNLRRYPAGGLARAEAAELMRKASGNEGMIQTIAGFLHQFPYARWREHPNEQEFLYYEAFRTLAAAYFDKRDLPAFYGLTRDLDFKSLNEIYRWNIMRAYVFRTMGADSLREAANYLMDRLVSRVNDGSMATNGLMPLDYANENAHKQLDERLTTEISMLNSMGQFELAKRYYSHVSEEGRYTHPDLNEAYMATLAHLGGQQEQQAFIEKCVHGDAVTAPMIDRLRELYVARQGSSAGFEAYFEGLKSALSIRKIHEVVRKGLIQLDFEPFAMESSNGGLIRSSDWDDKIVILDFWATWCKPCIESFPSMQKAVDRYKEDAGVLFYFVGTMQSGDYRQKDSAYLKSKGFRFNLLYDGIDTQTGGQNAVFGKLAALFHSSGIPRKVVMKNGFIRYTTEGFGGSASNLMEELSYAIELLKKEDNKN